MPPEAQNFYTAVLVASLLLGFVVIYFIITMIRHQKRNTQLYKAKITAEISTLENERKRIASDLHDELGPLLSTVKLRLNHLLVKTDEERTVVEQSNKSINEIMHKLRDISYNLLPNTLVTHGLIHAVEEYAERIQAVHELKIRFNCTGNFTLPKNKEINIYRILQEVIHNAIKHAEATLLLIELNAKQNQLLLTIADNGKGFDYNEKIKENKGLGLLNLQSRAEIINAKFSMQSEKGKGTNYFFEIPL